MPTQMYNASADSCGKFTVKIFIIIISPINKMTEIYRSCIFRAQLLLAPYYNLSYLLNIYLYGQYILLVSMPVCLSIHSFWIFLQRLFKSILLIGAPDTARILCRSFPPKRHRQLRVNDFPKAPTWQLERDSNPRPSSRQLSTIPMSDHVPQMSVCLSV